MKALVKAIVVLIMCVIALFADTEDGWSKSVQHYEKECAAGDTDACRTAGYFYEDGINVKQDYKKAANFYAKACCCYSSSLHRYWLFI
ncbi:MAG: hypothetical protein LBP40_07480 [Campylobacteraceae bacterium]|nr:hypothetical protein [Campylobacteraceae bacterium]